MYIDEIYMSHTKTLAMVVVLTVAVVVGIFGAHLVQPAHAEQCATAAASGSGSASASAEITTNKETTVKCQGQATPPGK